MSTGLNIRPAQESDCDRLAEIYQQSLDAKDSCMQAEVSASYFLEMVAKSGGREALLVVEDADVIYGWGVVKKYSDRVGYRVACETSIYLDRQSTGKGYGGKLQQALVDQAKTFGYHHIVAKIWASNEGSIRFHERFGYEVVGVQRQVGYMGGKWRDVAILQCVLDDVPPYRPELA